jgi:glycosyltransferase involved in cell wall biosynthesis
MRVAVYSDFPYRRFEGSVFADQAFVVFLIGLRSFVERLVLVGRLDPRVEPWHYRIPETVDFAPLPHYPALDDSVRALRTLFASQRRFSRILDEVDAVLLFGPHPLALLFAIQALARRKRVVLGIRQDYVPYVRSRHPGRRGLHVAARLLDAAFRLLARRCAVLTVGPELGRKYHRAPRLLATNVALIRADDVIADEGGRATSGGIGWTVLSVGRLDAEKNPLLLADVLARLGGKDLDRWRLTVCGEGPLKRPLQERIAELGLDQRVDLRGYVPVGNGLRRVYRESDCFLHTSLTEGVPQVLFEAFAAGLPVVATNVGSVAEVAGDAVILVPPGDAGAAAAAIERLAGDEPLRARLTAAGLKLVRGQTLEAQCERVVAFLAA